MAARGQPPHRRGGSLGLQSGRLPAAASSHRSVTGNGIDGTPNFDGIGVECVGVPLEELDVIDVVLLV